MARAGHPSLSISTDDLILLLTRDLKPVRGLARPALRALTWLSGVSAVALVIAASADLGAVHDRLAAAPDMWLSVIGSVLTLLTATLAAFEVSLPDRSHYWCVLPVPAVVLWLGASGLGCLRVALEFLPVHRATAADALRECLPFILGMSLPLALTIGWMLRRARPLRPGPVAVLAGLASASGSASLLWFVHPFDTSVIDVLVHATAVLVVMGGARATSGWVGDSRPTVGVILA